MNYELLFLKALGLTIALETALLILLAAGPLRWPEERPSWTRIVAAGIFASAATLPLIWFVLPLVFQTWWLAVLVGEVGVVLAEGIFYRLFLGLPLGQALAASLVCNLASFLLGIVIKV